jgi:hypothetical protein
MGANGVISGLHYGGVLHGRDAIVNWFERLTGFVEGEYEDTQRKLEVDGTRLRSRVNGRSYGIGELELVSLQALRERVLGRGLLPGRLRIRVMMGDVRRLHRSPEFAGATFQVASQFNLLEMISPGVTPEHGVSRYENDRTQGPACAIAGGAATIYRNYFAPVNGAVGQTSARQLDGLADVGAALSKILGVPVGALWSMRNGYALCSRTGLDGIGDWMESSMPDAIDAVRGKLRVGVHRDVEVTDSTAGEEGGHPPVVSQVFCSALPVAYSDVPPIHWRAFATLVLEAAYEATMWAALECHQRGGSNVVLLTSLGGGAFGNGEEWIMGAMRRAFRLAAEFDLDVRVVSYGEPSRAVVQLCEGFT